MNEKTYREGDEEIVDAVPKEMPPVSAGMPAPTSINEGPAPDEQEGPAHPHIMAVLIVMKSDMTLEITSDLQGIKVQRKPSLRDVRDMCHSAYCDLQSTMVGKVAAENTVQSIRNTLADGPQKQQPAIVTPGRG